MIYSIGQMAKKLNIAPSTLRYYDREGLLPFVERSNGGMRIFTDADYEWLQVIECLKKTGMQLKDIKVFVEMAMQGDETIDLRLALIIKQKETVKAKLRNLKKLLICLNLKSGIIKPPKKVVQPPFREICLLKICPNNSKKYA